MSIIIIVRLNAGITIVLASISGNNSITKAITDKAKTAIENILIDFCRIYRVSCTSTKDEEYI
jgi:hypothetical protein